MKKQESVPLLLSCREASRLISEALDRELTRRERWALRIHTIMCSACRRFSAQLIVLRQTVGKMPDRFRQQWPAQPTRLSQERRATIKRLLAEAGRRESQN